MSVFLGLTSLEELLLVPSITCKFNDFTASVLVIVQTGAATLEIGTAVS